ncbi:hypothetical protein [Alkaliphilus sp. B6464]|uniref:hypothetical protein n=1 Tax=Alkaliphilus sp. B6464 TaxID=2731219 RepID=UPI001BA7F270|nr:hypothetical protein [Alkaliphilus sp. B6464]QUH19551.1 hypothetical protein HYG84_06370 [Alkaliphilus sp. B6464]
MKEFLKNNIRIIIGILALSLLFLSLIRPKSDLMSELSNSNISYMSITFIEGYSKEGNKSTSKENDIDWFINYITSFNVKEVKKNNLYEDSNSHIGIALLSNKDENSLNFLIEIIDDKLIYISTKLKNQNTRTSTTYMILDSEINRNELYKFYDSM